MKFLKLSEELLNLASPFGGTPETGVIREYFRELRPVMDLRSLAWLGTTDLASKDQKRTTVQFWTWNFKRHWYSKSLNSRSERALVQILIWYRVSARFFARFVAPFVVLVLEILLGENSVRAYSHFFIINSKSRSSKILDSILTPKILEIDFQNFLPFPATKIAKFLFKLAPRDCSRENLSK